MPDRGFTCPSWVGRSAWTVRPVTCSLPRGDGAVATAVAAVRERTRPPAVPSVRIVPPTAAESLDEPTLVVRAQEGDTRAFETLARRHQAALHRVAVRLMGDRAAAEDALQEALVDAWRRIEHFRGGSAFSTWLYRIVTHRCTGMLRQRRPVPLEHSADIGLGVAPDLPERAVEIDAELVALGAALRTLPDDLRVCWVLRELEGMAYEEIAAVVGAGEPTVRGRTHRARTTLAEVRAQRLDAAVHRLAAQRIEPPPSVMDRVMTAVTGELRPADVILVASPLGPNRLSRPAAAAVIRAVVDGTAGLRARSCRVNQAAGEVAVDVAVTVTARFGVDLAPVTARVRGMVVAAGEQALGVPVRRVDIEVVDVWQS